MKRYAIVLAPALAGALFGASAIAVLVKPADAETTAAIRAGDTFKQHVDTTGLLAKSEASVVVAAR